MVFFSYKNDLGEDLYLGGGKKNVILYEMQRGTAAKCQVLLILRNTCRK